MLVRNIMGAATALLLTSAVIAQTPAAGSATAGAPDANTLAAARAFMKVADVGGQMHAVMPRMAQAAGEQLQSMFGQNKVPDGLRTQFVGAIQAYMGSIDDVFTPTLIDQIATVYARRLSADDLHRLTTLMSDPAMARLRAASPEIAAEMMPIVMTAMRPRQQAFVAKMKQIVADWIRDHPEDKAKLAHPASS